MDITSLCQMLVRVHIVFEFQYISVQQLQSFWIVLLSLLFINSSDISALCATTSKWSSIDHLSCSVSALSQSLKNWNHCSTWNINGFNSPGTRSLKIQAAGEMVYTAWLVHGVQRWCPLGVEAITITTLEWKPELIFCVLRSH